jgi:hypothetical protein
MRTNDLLEDGGDTMLHLKGRQGKTIIVDGATVTITKKGWIAASQREKIIPIRNITSVEVKKPGSLVVGFIQFAIAGGASRDSSFKFTGGTFDAVKDENSVVFADEESYANALQIKEYIENYRENSTVDMGASVSASDEIIKLKGLMDQGIISAKEFKVKKRQLLGI